MKVSSNIPVNVENPHPTLASTSNKHFMEPLFFFFFRRLIVLKKKRKKQKQGEKLQRVKLDPQKDTKKQKDKSKETGKGENCRGGKEN